MANNALLKEWVIEALKALKGQANVVEISRYIWEHHETELRQQGDLFFTWQYAMRWAAQTLQHEGKLSKGGKNRTWFLVN